MPPSLIRSWASAFTPPRTAADRRRQIVAEEKARVAEIIRRQEAARKAKPPTPTAKAKSAPRRETLSERVYRTRRQKTASFTQEGLK